MELTESSVKLSQIFQDVDKKVEEILEHNKNFNNELEPEIRMLCLEMVSVDKALPNHEEFFKWMASVNNKSYYDIEQLEAKGVYENMDMCYQNFIYSDNDMNADKTGFLPSINATGMSQTNK